MATERQNYRRIGTFIQIVAKKSTIVKTEVTYVKTGYLDSLQFFIITVRDHPMSIL